MLPKPAVKLTYLSSNKHIFDIISVINLLGKVCFKIHQLHHKYHSHNINSEKQVDATLSILHAYLDSMARVINDYDEYARPYCSSVPKKLQFGQCARAWSSAVAKRHPLGE